MQNLLGIDRIEDFRELDEHLARAKRALACGSFLKGSWDGSATVI